MGKGGWLLNFLNHAKNQESVENLDKNGAVKAPSSGFKMPLHYPRYTKEDYEEMEEWRLDLLLSEYGLLAFHDNTLHEKRAFAIDTFIWPHHP
ncbi:hypothetical protein AtNW77_Chr3g0165271 [Arabidopsis thaliana]|uniref:At3g09950 n=4 Tax=Arabidopsis TaxID=3701 RepID=Q9SR60_ARATH|nr:uncharacterized protein AT3G09950 [Arabidopsis thaliana]KAG7624653.1 hypothetical protein ISN45_At03g009570 [Arabidopsis thaliana x Arabidopsis arenosa]KAG7630664.1 hypothetical protein ISN44_As03g009680 [Arabidopsis suecica]AAF04428.1 hypothetical protein [Arabidopsis thaliana]ABD57467.1 At3g09950 [Arabidopsis thaliana]AEE74840.1 hypothetical protein AT3G09950 [Arabidopsis thaliana]|eukprot:NP_566362.1 hypothetical protein AT3G09950 [Arabidopsis thaliana]